MGEDWARVIKRVFVLDIISLTPSIWVEKEWIFLILKKILKKEYQAIKINFKTTKPFSI